MHLEFLPADAPEPEPDAQISVPPEHITELLELCEQFFRQASPSVHTELRQFLTEHGHHGGLGWFLDALSFHHPEPHRPEDTPAIIPAMSSRSELSRNPVGTKIGAERRR